MKYVPEREEIETIKAFTGDENLLGPAEKYFVAILPIPDLEAKFHAMSFKLEVFFFFLFSLFSFLFFPVVRPLFNTKAIV